MTALVEALGAAKIVAVLRAGSTDALEVQLDTVREGGVRAIEVTTTAPGWERVLERAVRESGDHLLIGAGTVTTVAQAAAARAAGARFLVAPHRVPTAVVDAVDSLPFIPGGFTPGEIAEAAIVGGGVAKLFPAATGGLAHLRALRDVLPDVAIMPTGGIAPEDAGDWLRAGAVAVGLGGALVRQTPARIREVLAALDAGSVGGGL